MTKYTFEVIIEEFLIFAKVADFGSDYEPSKRMGVNRVTPSRVLAGTLQPGAGFIAGAMMALKLEDVGKIFRIVTTQDLSGDAPCVVECSEDTKATIAQAANDHRIGCPVRFKAGAGLRKLYEVKKHGGPHFGIATLAHRYRVESMDVRELIVEAGGTIRPKGANSRPWRENDNRSASRPVQVVNNRQGMQS